MPVDMTLYKERKFNWAIWIFSVEHMVKCTSTWRSGAGGDPTLANIKATLLEFGHTLTSLLLWAGSSQPMAPWPHNKHTHRGTHMFWWLLCYNKVKMLQVFYLPLGGSSRVFCICFQAVATCFGFKIIHYPLSTSAIQHFISGLGLVDQ